MGFFGPSKEEKQQIKLSLGQSFQNGKLLRGIINCIKYMAENEEDKKWILNATGYYDSRESNRHRQSRYLSYEVLTQKR